MFQITNTTPLAALTVGQFQELIRNTINIQEPKEVKQILNINEVSELSGFSKNTLYKFTSLNQIPFFKRGSKVLFKRSEIEDWLLSSKQLTTEESSDKLDSDLMRGRK